MRVDRIVDAAASVDGAAPDAALKAALIEEGQAALSYAGLEARIAAAARSLQAAGVAAGQRVLLVGENSADMVVLLFAAMRAGAWAVPLNARMAADEIDAIRAHCRPRLAYFATASSPEAAAHAERAGAGVHAGEGLQRGPHRACSPKGSSPTAATTAATATSP